MGQMDPGACQDRDSCGLLCRRISFIGRIHFRVSRLSGHIQMKQAGLRCMSAA